MSVGLPCGGDLLRTMLLVVVVKPPLSVILLVRKCGKESIEGTLTGGSTGRSDECLEGSSNSVSSLNDGSTLYDTPRRGDSFGKSTSASFTNERAELVVSCVLMRLRITIASASGRVFSISSRTWLSWESFCSCSYFRFNATIGLASGSAS